MATYEKIFAERLRKLRTENRYSQPQIGEVVGVGKSAVNGWEHGRGYPAFLGLCQLADFFDVSLDYLVGRSDNPKVSRPRKAEPATADAALKKR